MPTIPDTVKLTRSAVDILNAIRNQATADYRNYIPEATGDDASIRNIGNVIMDYPALQNEFLHALVNRIGRVIVTSKTYENPWAIFKKGLLEYGETIEDVFVNVAKPFQYDPAVAESKVFARENPDVRAVFYIMNYRKFYKSTIMQEQLRQAFLSWQGITDLIAKIVEAMYTGANYDEFTTMKYMLARHILNGQIYPKTVSAVSEANMKSIVSTIKGISNKFTFMSTAYNLTGVATHTLKEDQYVIVNSDFESIMSVEVLAAAFNMDKAEFSGHVILVDGFGELDDTRLNELFGSNPDYVAITSAEKTALNAIPAIIVDKDFFMIYDNLFNFTENFNGEGMYWNYWYHVWKTFAISPFANAVLFVPATPSITSVDVSPSSATVTKGQSILLTATVVTANFASKAVDWTLSAVIPGGVGEEDTPVEDLDASITPLGVLTVGPEVTTGVVITATATSVVDSTKTDYATITVA